MKLSSQEECGLRCLVQLARSGEGQTLTISDLSRLEGLSVANAAKMLRLLRQGGFVTSVRGQAGGYRLAVPASQIRIGDVLAKLGGRLYDEDFCRRHGLEEGGCRHARVCAVRPVWEKLQSAVDGVLGVLTLEGLTGDGPTSVGPSGGAVSFGSKGTERTLPEA